MIRLAVLGEYQSADEEKFFVELAKDLEGIASIEKMTEQEFTGDYAVALGDECFALDQFEVLNYSVRKYGYWNWAERSSGKWIPGSTIGATLQSLIVNYQPHLDNSLPAFLVGSNPLISESVEALAKFGFKNFYIMASDKKQLDLLKPQLHRAVFGLQINLIEPKNLITYSGTGSVLINTESLKEEDTVYFNVSYFNYLKKESFVLSFSPSIPAAFYKEANEVGLQAIAYSTYFSQSFLHSPFAKKIKDIHPDLDLASKIQNYF